jgi:hypothetical protein
LPRIEDVDEKKIVKQVEDDGLRFSLDTYDFGDSSAVSIPLVLSPQGTGKNFNPEK